MGKGWLGAPLIKKRLQKVQKIRSAQALRHGVQAGLGGLPWWRSGGGGQAPGRSYVFLMQKQHFQRKLIAFDESVRNCWAYHPARALCA